MKQQSKKYLLLILLIAVLVAPTVALASWWNPFSWNWNAFFHNQPKTTQNVVGGDKDSHGCIGSAGYTWCEVKNKCLRVWEEKCEKATGISVDSLRNITLSYPNPYNTSKTDTFTLVNGESALLYDTGKINPRGYTSTATSVAMGDLNGDGATDGAIALYQGWGANRITPIIFIVSNENGKLKQIDSILPDTSNWQDETQIKSLSINNGILSANLLLLSDADKNLPHYQQTPTVAKTVQYKLENGKLVLQPTGPIADCIDTDGGLNYYTAGQAYIPVNGPGHNPQFLDDGCRGNILTEAYCSNGYVASKTYTCPNGCSNLPTADGRGACIK